MSCHFGNMWHLHQNMHFVFFPIFFFFTHGYSLLQFDFQYVVGSQMEHQNVNFFILPFKTRSGSTFSNTTHFLDSVYLSSCNLNIYNWEVFETWEVVLPMGRTLLEMLSSNDYQFWSTKDSKSIEEGSSIETSMLCESSTSMEKWLFDKIWGTLETNGFEKTMASIKMWGCLKP